MVALGIIEGRGVEDLGRDGVKTGALQRIFETAQGVDPKTMTLQYFETLKALGASPSTKYIFPMEFTGLLESFVKDRKE